MLGIKIDNIDGITSFNTYSNGKIETCIVNKPNVVSTEYGDLIPRYNKPGIRDKELKSISFYESGEIRSIDLDTQTDVLTPLGKLPAELVTFYEDGSLESIFPLNGQIGFGWSEKEEKSLAQTVSFDFPFGSFETKPIGLRFYKSGELKSLIIWPDEVIEINSPVGKIPVRIGFKLYETGKIESLEPALPIKIKTPIGDITTYDITAVGVDADFNSLRFYENGSISHIVMSGDIVVKNKTDGSRKIFSSGTRLGLTDDFSIKVPISITFFDDRVLIDDGSLCESFEISVCDFLLLPDYSMVAGGSCAGECDGCTICS